MSPVPNSVRLEKLSIDEVSGVDVPANLLDGWLVMKAAGPGYSIGPDQSWDVSAAEKRIRSATGAEDSPNSKYASCFLSKSGDGSKYGDYKFLVCDVVDGDIKAMPQAIRAAASGLTDTRLSTTEKSAVQNKINVLESKAGIGETKKSEEASSILAKVKDLIFPGLPNQGEVEDMTPEEIAAEIEKVLEVKLQPLQDTVTEISKSVAEAAPAEGAASTESETPAVTEETITKAITDGITAALEPYNEILEKALDRIELVEKSQGRGVRKSLDGQEANATEETVPAKPSVGDAIMKAFRNPSNPVAVAALAEKE